MPLNDTLPIVQDGEITVPRFWSEEISLWGGEEMFRVRAKPKGLRGNKLLSWLPYRTGDKFIANVEVSRVRGTRALEVHCTLKEPDGGLYPVITKNNPSLPFTDSTDRRYLATKGEYILDVTLVSLDSTDKTKVDGFNRRLITLEAISQDVAVANILMALAGGVVGAILTLVIASVR